ncbi:MAG: XrtB/PEP-CTERM-associated transcriptional regulator EpsA [Pseudomonadota bacterium]
MSHPSFSPEQSESLLRLIEASVQVSRRYQFYLWTQGDLQRLMQHKLSSCGAYDIGMRELVFDVLNSVLVPAELISALTDGHSPVMTYIQTEWGKSRQQACWIDLTDFATLDSSAAGLCELGYRWILTHGVSRPGRPTDMESFFVFGLPGAMPDRESAYALNMLLPYLHSTYLRVHTTEREMGAAGKTGRGGAQANERVRNAVSITEREREILRWVRDGKNNQAIAEELNISPLTVKNHIQKILRKLTAANRAQAVAKAMSMNLFGAGQESASTPVVQWTA